MFISVEVRCLTLCAYFMAAYASISGTYGLPKPWYFPFTQSYWCYGYTETNACSVKQLFGIRQKEYCPVDDIDEDITDSG